MFEGAGDVVGGLAGLDAALDTRPVPLLAQHAHQRPAGRLTLGFGRKYFCPFRNILCFTHRNTRYFCDGFHLLDVSDGHLGYPKCAGHVSPLVPGARALHGATLQTECA